MIFKGFSTYLRLTTRTIFKSNACDLRKPNFFTTKISFLQSTQRPIQNQQKKKKRVSKPRSQQPVDKNVQRQIKQTEQDNEHAPQDLARILKKFRINLQENVNKIGQIIYHTKKIADYYKKTSHDQFVQQKYQIQGILSTIATTNFANIELTQYFCLLDFIRICSNLESINYHIFTKAQNAVFALLKNYQQKILSLSLQQLSTLYCKVTPVYHPDAFAISSLLHDSLASSLQENKTIKLTIMQIYVIIRSMGKKQFLSFPDKKILEMMLRILNENRIEKDRGMVIQLAVALKDIQVEVNISDWNICQISRKILERAVRYANKGLDYKQTQYLILSKKTQNPYFIAIFQALSRNMFKQLQNQQEQISLNKLKRLFDIIKQLPSSHTYSLQQKQSLIKLCEKYLKKESSEKNKQNLSYQILDVIRNNFFDDHLQLLNPLFQSKTVDFVWSFPFEYNRKKVPFPLQIMEAKITQNTSKFRTQASNLRTAVAIATQARLHPTSEVLNNCYNKIVEQIKAFPWTLDELAGLAKIGIFDPYLLEQFHQQYQTHFFTRLIPSDEQIKKQRDIKKGDKSDLLKFWQYLMIQNEAPYQLVSKVPLYAIHLTAFREKRIKNNVIHAKPVLLQGIEFKLSSGKIKFADQDSSHIIDLLILYSSNLDSQNENLCELYWKCVHHLISQYSSLRKTTVPYANHLISKLIHIESTRVRRSIYYKIFLSELISAVGILSMSNKYDYFKTAIIREGLHNNLVSDLHLPQIQLTFYSPQQKNMLKALSGKYELKQYSPLNLISLFKLTKLPQQVGGDIEKILQVVDKSTIGQLSKYLQHYSFQKTLLGQKILGRICSAFIEKLDIERIDIISLLKNLTQLSNNNFKLFERVIKTICEKLLLNPSVIYLADHYQILKTLHEEGILNQAYSQGLWEHAKKSTNKSSKFVSIMLELSKNKQDIEFDASDIDQAIKFVLVSPQDLLKLLIYHEDSISDIKAKWAQISSLISSPLQKCLFLAYLQSKYGLLIAKSKSNAPILFRANLSASKLIKSLQNEGVSIKLDEKSGEYIYHINDQAILVFINYRYANESKLISKMLHHLYPDKQIIQVNSESGSKEYQQILHELHSINGSVFNSGLIERLEAELRTN